MVSSGSSGQSLPPERDFMQRAEALRQQIGVLEYNLSRIKMRLDSLEASVRAGQFQAAPLAAPPRPPVPTAAVQPPPAPPPSAPRAAPRPPSEWEQILGGNWLARIGVVALIFGIGFFLKYASDRHWIGPWGWIALGVVAGLALLWAGYHWRQRYPILSQALSGGGVAALYLTFFAAYVGLHLLAFYPAVTLLFLISLGTAGLALAYDSMALAILGMIGAYGAPFFLGFGSRGPASLVSTIQLPLYIMVLDLGVLALSAFRNWRWFNLLALIGSILAFVSWYYQAQPDLLTAELVLTAIFLIFTGVTLFHHAWRRSRAREFDFAFFLVNFIFYFALSLILLRGERGWLPGFTLLLGLFCGTLAYTIYRRNPASRPLSSTALGLGLGLLTLTVPLQFRDSVWVTLLWSGEFVVLLVLSARLPELAYYGYGVFVLAVGRLLLVDTRVDLVSFRPVLNQRVLAYAGVIAASYLAAYLLRRRPSRPETAGAAAPFLVAANVLTVLLLSLEVWDFFARQLADLTARASGHELFLRGAQNLSLTAVWALYALVLLALGIRQRSQALRLGALALLGLATLKLFLYDVWALSLLYRVIAFVGLGLLLIVSAYLYQRYSRAIRGFFSKQPS